MAALRITNLSSRPDATVEQIVRWVVEHPTVQPLSGILHVRVIDQADGGYGGMAFERGATPKWAKRARYAIRLSLPSDDWYWYGRDCVCWHSTALTEHARTLYWAWRVADPDKDDHATWRSASETAMRIAARNPGRWPVYRVNDWIEALVHVTAHEAHHIVQYDNDRPRSEVDCERYALARLEEYRRECAANASVSDAATLAPRPVS